MAHSWCATTLRHNAPLTILKKQKRIKENEKTELHTLQSFFNHITEIENTTLQSAQQLLIQNNCITVLITKIPKI